MPVRALDLDAARYARHALHAEDLAWTEKNCYFDVWIEVLNALGCEPTAVIPSLVAIDFLGDQWTFFKPSHDELRSLYGVDVQELTCWRPLLEHATEHLGAGRLIATEAEAWWLPDVAGTDYRRQHVKTTIVLADVDVGQRRLGYFHNAGYFSLEGEDFDRTFRIGQEGDRAVDPQQHLPLYAELLRIDRVSRRPAAELRAMSRQLLGTHLALRPRDNPIDRFAERFALELPRLQERGLPHYHAWAFATLRQLGAASELLACHLRWLVADGGAQAGQDAGASAASELQREQALRAAEAFDSVSAGTKAFILKAARAVNTRRAFDFAPSFEAWSAAWQDGQTALSSWLSLEPVHDPAALAR